MMKSNAFLVILFLLAGMACSSSKTIQSPPPLPELSQTETAILRTITKPSSKGMQTSSVYVENVQKVQYNSTPGLLISGNLPNNCVELTSVKQVIQGNNIRFIIEAAQPKGSTCSQALEPFTTFIPFTYEKDVRSLQGYAIGENAVFSSFK